MVETGILGSEDLLNTKDIRTYFEETAPMGSAHHHRSCLTGDTGQNPKMTRTVRIKQFTQIYRTNQVDALQRVECEQTHAFCEVQATFRVKTCFSYFQGNLDNLMP